MTKQDILAEFDEFTEHLLLALAESDHLKKQVRELMADNARLRLENQQLQDLLSKLQVVETEETEESLQKTNGRKHLEEIYMAGFHVCNELYGKAHDTNDGCLDCTELLYRD